MTTLSLYEPTQAHKALATLWLEVKARITAGQRLRLSLAEEKRTDEQNKLFHALCSDIARYGTFAGQKRTADQWKVLLVSGHATATKEGSEILPGLEGEFVNIRESTALMSKKRGASLIEYTLAYAAMNQIPTLGYDDATH